MPNRLPCEEAVRFFESSADLCCIFGPDGRVVYANPATERISGYSDAELRAIAVWDLIHPDERNAFDQGLRRVLSGSHYEGLQTRFRTAAGGYLWLLWSASAAEDRIFATARDITEIRNRQEERFHRLFETSKDAMLLIDAASGSVLECNRYTEELLARERKILQGEDIREVFAPSDVGRRMFEALKRSETFRAEENIPKDGAGAVPCEMVCNRYREESGEVIQANIRDISDRRRSEAALRESEERFRVLVEGVRDYAIFMSDPQGRVMSWNHGAERILGYAEGEILARDAAILFTPEDRERGEPEHEMETAVREGRAEDERWHLRKDGSRFFASGVLTSLWRDDHQLRGFAKVMRDITERKTQEEAMREAQKLESIGLLAGGVAHDFNNLLTGIIGNASLAAEDLPLAHPSARLIQEVIAAGRRAADLTRQLLAYAGKGRFTVESFRISDAVSEILHLIHASIPERIRLELRLDDKAPPIEADPTQIQQIAMNLVLNAAEAIEGDGVIRISTTALTLREEGLRGSEGISNLRPGHYVVLRVEDSGSGMSEETKARIFDPFFTTKFTGRGLGLAAVSGIVRGHRGAILVVTAPGKGSSFEVYFPATQNPAKLWRAEEAVPREHGSETVLVVDDDESVRRVSSQALERRGYRVITAGNGREAVDIFRRDPGNIDMVVLDLAMPVMSGEDAHRLMKEIRPDVPILVTSGYSELMASSRFGRRGMEAFLQKPYTAAQLVDRVQKVLAGARRGVDERQQ